MTSTGPPRTRPRDDAPGPVDAGVVDLDPPDRAGTRRLVGALRGRAPRLLLGVALVLVLAGLVVAPMVTVGFGAFWSQSPIMPGGELTVDNWGEVLSDESFRSGAVTSLVIGVCVTVLCTVVASTLAFLVARTDAYFKGAIEVTVYVNLAISPFVLATSWIALATPRAGLLNLVGGLENLNVSSMAGIIFVMVTFFVPWFYVLVKPSMLAADSSLEEAATVHGATRTRMLWNVTAPLVRPGFLGAVLLVFVLSVDTFSIPALLGAPVGIRVLPYQMYSYVYGFPAAWERSAVIGIVLLLFAVALLLLRDRLVGDVRRYRVVGGKGGRARVVPIRRGWRHALSWAGLVYGVVSTVLPVLGLVVGAFLKYAAGQGLTADTFTLSNFDAVFANARFQESVRTTVLVMVVAAVADVVLCLAVTILVFRTRVPVLSTLAGLLVRAPVGIPGIVLGTGLLWAYVGLPLAVYGTVVIFFVGLSTRYLAQTYNIVSSSYLQISPELREAALVSGARPLRIVRDVDLPLMARALGVSLLFTMILVSGEVNTSVMIASPEASTLPIFLYQILSGAGNPQHAYVVALVQIGLVAVVGTVAWLVGWLLIRRVGAGRGPRALDRGLGV
jgi:iron(III) transport system permease protein